MTPLLKAVSKCILCGEKDAVYRLVVTDGTFSFSCCTYRSISNRKALPSKKFCSRLKAFLRLYFCCLVFNCIKCIAFYQNENLKQNLRYALKLKLVHEYYENIIFLIIRSFNNFIFLCKV